MPSMFFNKPLATDLIERLREEEANRRMQRMCRRGLALMPDGQLRVGDSQPFELTAEAQKDLAALVRIPTEYFCSIEPRLQAINYRFRAPTQPDADKPVTIVWNGNRVARIHENRLNLLPRHKILQAMLEAAPAEAQPGRLRAVVYALNGHVDLALVSASLKSEPRVGDDVFHGIHVTVDVGGAIQVGAMTLRLLCSNGAMVPVCANGKHRIRRGNQSNDYLLNSVAEFSAAAWKDWGRLAEGLKRLTQQPVERAALPDLVSRLRQSPFFISARAAGRVLAEVEGGEAGQATLYDFHNAITAVGSHANDVLWRYRHRLRLGAGSLARGRVSVCQKCRQMVLAGE